mmetsp:Transcript_24785/g.80167  ORF Transcript_24785/g.80167 Transcript_24785/m.80167 type:complete len:268 (+) Transcript_24785:1264-2067(+)
MKKCVPRKKDKKRWRSSPPALVALVEAATASGAYLVPTGRGEEARKQVITRLEDWGAKHGDKHLTICSKRLKQVLDDEVGAYDERLKKGQRSDIPGLDRALMDLKVVGADNLKASKMTAAQKEAEKEKKARVTALAGQARECGAEAMRTGAYPNVRARRTSKATSAHGATDQAVSGDDEDTGSAPTKKAKVDIGAAVQASVEADVALRRRELELREGELKLQQSRFELEANERHGQAEERRAATKLLLALAEAVARRDGVPAPTVPS